MAYYYSCFPNTFTNQKIAKRRLPSMMDKKFKIQPVVLSVTEILGITSTIIKNQVEFANKGFGNIVDLA